MTETTTPKNKSCRTLGLSRSIQKNSANKIKGIQNSLRLGLSPLTLNSNSDSIKKSLLISSQKLKKKKLDFTQDKENDLKAEIINILSLSDEEVKTEIEKKEKLLNEFKLHEEKVKQLESSINTWKNAFQQGLEDLREKMDPPPDEAKLLEMLKIPAKMLNI